jgi:hypothetical protein
MGLENSILHYLTLRKKQFNLPQTTKVAEIGRAINKIRENFAFFFVFLSVLSVLGGKL